MRAIRAAQAGARQGSGRNKARQLSSLIPAFAPFLDDRLAIASPIAFTSGVVRGFSGFGQARSMCRFIAALYGPRLAVTTLLLIDTPARFHFCFRAAACALEADAAFLAAVAALTISNT